MEIVVENDLLVVQDYLPSRLVEQGFRIPVRSFLASALYENVVQLQKLNMKLRDQQIAIVSIIGDVRDFLVLARQIVL